MKKQIKNSILFKDLIREELDLVLGFAMRHTDRNGLYTVDGEIDRKDPGWLVLGGVIRGLDAGGVAAWPELWDYCRKWTLAAIRTDDRRSAWTTFALLYAIALDGGVGGAFFQGFTPSERGEIVKFVRQLDFKYLREASRNYQAAAGFIGELAVRFGFIERDRLDMVPDASIRIMLDGYLGDGFFNDDDCRNPGGDCRIDGYSAEIIGLLLHYDEIFGFHSFCHEELTQIIVEFCRANIWLNDADGEYAKWGRSLRGEAEIKKAMIWEYAEQQQLTDAPGIGLAIARRLLDFFRLHGRSAEGQVYKDKGCNLGIWDEYTTHVQAQGYGVYGLAMALKFASADRTNVTAPLPAENENYVRILHAPGIVTGNTQGAFHYVAPLKNRFTRPMYFWHNRLTGENDAMVDVSHKFLPLPYFGCRLPSPYSGPEIPFLPMLSDESGVLLTPRNFDSGYTMTALEDVIKVQRGFGYSPVGKYDELPAPELMSDAEFRADGFTFRFVFDRMPEAWRIHLFFPLGNAVTTRLEHGVFRLDWPDRHIVLETTLAEMTDDEVAGGKSIYGGPTRLLRLTALPLSEFSYIWKYSAK